AYFFPIKFAQLRDELVVLYEHFGVFRQVFLDGRALPKEPNPTWLGYSAGRWEGDDLVIESSGFNGKTWLDDLGHPTTESLSIVERLRRVDLEHIQLRLTVDDAKAYTKPWTITESLELFPDGELIEYVCNENEKDIKHYR